MEQKIYHGPISPQDFSHALMGYFNRGNYKVQQVGETDKVIIQIATNERSQTGGQTALSIALQKVEDGVSVQVGQQAWIGIAGSIGLTLLSAIQNPWNLLGRIDDLAQDIESLQITQDIWKILEHTAHQLGAGQELSERLRRMVCSYCNSANPIGESNCIACGAPLGDVQPRTCSKCGFVITKDERICPNCGNPV